MFWYKAINNAYAYVPIGGAMAEEVLGGALTRAGASLSSSTELVICNELERPAYCSVS
jgi:hypothetical protein